MTYMKSNKTGNWGRLALAMGILLSESAAFAMPIEALKKIPRTSFQLAEVKTLTTPEFYKDWSFEQAQVWFAKHPFFKTPPKIQSGMQPSIFCSQKMAKEQALNLQISYQNQTAKTPDFVQLWLVQNNPHYPVNEQRFLLPNIWQHDSAQAQQFLATALGQVVADDFKQAKLVKEEKGGEYALQQTYFQGKHFVYSVMTQYDEDAAYREGEKGYTPYQTFFILYPPRFLAEADKP